MSTNTWLLSGIPRSGSSLCCRLAGELPNTVGLSEPIRQDTFKGADTREAACRRINEFAVQARARIQAEGLAPSVQVDGRLDDDMVSQHPSDSLRQRRARQGEIAVRKPLSSDFTLLIKHNALFAALLPTLAQSFHCLALVRNPVAVLASWQTVDLPVNRGRIPIGERFDPDLCNALSDVPDTLRRQVIVLNWFFAAYGERLDSGHILRYEDLVSSGGTALFRLIGKATVPPVSLENRDGSLLYRRVSPDVLLAALIEAGGAWSDYYSVAECEQVANLIRSIKPERTADTA